MTAPTNVDSTYSLSPLLETLHKLIKTVQNVPTFFAPNKQYPKQD